MINFNIPPYTGKEIEYIQQAVANRKICGDGEFTKKCNKWLEDRFCATKVLLTTSGTTALDMAMLLCDIKPGDEVILPSYTFSSTATSAVLAGAKLVQHTRRGQGGRTPAGQGAGAVPVLRQKQ